MGFETAETCFDLYSIVCGESSACNTKVFNLFTLVHPFFMNTAVYPFYSSKVRANIVPTVEITRSSPNNVHCCVLVFFLAGLLPHFFVFYVCPFLAKPLKKSYGPTDSGIVT